MKTKTFSLMVLILGLILAFSAPQALAQTRPEYIPLGGGVKGVLYRPDSNPSPNVAVIIIHRTANYLQHAGCTQLSQRGLMVLCMNSRFDNNEASGRLGADSTRRETWRGLPQDHAEDQQSRTVRSQRWWTDDDLLCSRCRKRAFVLPGT